jgi:hypothetical protein
MPEPAYAIVEMLCNPVKLKELKAIPNLRIEVRPEYTADPAVIRIIAFADAAAQDAAHALGCTVTVRISAEDYRKQVEETYRSIGKDTDPSEPN